MKILSIFSLSLLLIGKLSAQTAGPYAPPVGQTGSTAIYKDSAVFTAWATYCELNKGWQNIADTSLGKTTIGIDSSALGKSGVNGLVSLGDGGIATLTFNGFIYNDVGADFAVFENSFDGMFLELAFVEVSSDGINFFRFDAVSLTQDTQQLDNNANMDATNIYNLAGKYRANYGTPFDLDELSGIAGLDISKITHVRIIDVVGSINPLFGTTDNQNNKINDPFPTPFASGGFDLDAVGVIHYSTTSVEELFASQFNVYPNPFNEVIHIENKSTTEINYQLIDIYGKILISESASTSNFQLSTSNFSKGIYFLTITQDSKTLTKKLIKTK
ncbi:MAG: T9SS type A sorting domain-containing protein [Flavobacteriales bacterium]